MFTRVYRLARQARNLPGIRNSKKFWNLVHRPYYDLLRRTGWSVNYALTPNFTFRIPAYFLRQDWKTYEPDATLEFIDWFQTRSEKPRLLLDIGTSIGFYSAVALSADPDVKIFAFDADMESLRLVPMFCATATNPARMEAVWCFLDCDVPPSHSLEEAVAFTATQDKKLTHPARLEHMAYRSLVEKVDLPATPVYTLDSITEGGKSLDDYNVLYKCDVEGAELRVLQGSRELLMRVRPTIMLSVHAKEWLAQYDTTRDQIEDFLREAGYQWKVYPTDHEEHWIAHPLKAA